MEAHPSALHARNLRNFRLAPTPTPQIIEICLVTRSLNGGLISLQDLTQRLRKRSVVMQM